MFLFYASPSTSTLTYTIWYNISRCLYIFNMISEPNFVHGIKQTSIHSKEVSYMHSTDPQYPCLFLDLNPTASHSFHGLPSLSCHHVSNHSPSNPCLPFQICANQGFAWWNQHHRRAPRLPATKTQELSLHWQSHAPPSVDKGSSFSSYVSPKFSTPR